MIQILEQLDGDFKITIINMLKALMKKVNNSHEQMKNFSRDRNYKKKPNENARS